MQISDTALRYLSLDFEFIDGKMTRREFFCVQISGFLFVASFDIFNISGSISECQASR